MHTVIIDSARRDMVCTWAWWGPDEAWNVVGEIVRGPQSLALGALRVVPHGSLDEDMTDLPTVQARGSATITPALLKRIPLGRLLAQVHAELASAAIAADRSEQWSQHVRTVQAKGDGEPRRGRPSLADSLIRSVAVAYIEDAAAGPGLTKRLAERFGCQPATMRDWIRVARKRGWLTTGEHGRRNAAPGPRMEEEMYGHLLPDGSEPPTTLAERAALVAAQAQDPKLLSDQPPF